LQDKQNYQLPAGTNIKLIDERSIRV